MKLVEIEYVNQSLMKGASPYYIYAIVEKGEEVGRITLREGTIQERYYDGHIGYTIYEEYRGHYYALLASRLVLKQAREKGFTELVITCSPDNLASKKTIQKLGAKYIETKNVPKSILKFLPKGENIKEIYRIDLYTKD